jgi:hypothetical protein
MYIDGLEGGTEGGREGEREGGRGERESLKKYNDVEQRYHLEVQIFSITCLSVVFLVVPKCQEVIRLLLQLPLLLTSSSHVLIG